jgi:hypothetical protein
VKLQQRLIYLEAKHTKDKEPRKVPICGPLFRMLQEMPGKVAESGKARHVFTYKGKFPARRHPGRHPAGLQAGRH